MVPPTPPFWPMMVIPPAKTTLALPGSLETPKLLPRKSIEVPWGPVVAFWAGETALSGADANTRFKRLEAFISSVIVEAPRRKRPRFTHSVMPSVEVELPRRYSSPPRKTMSRASAEPVPRRPLAMMLSTPETVSERLSRTRRLP